MDICQREGLHQVDLLSPAPDRISPQEYYAKQRGQQNLDIANMELKLVFPCVKPCHQCGIRPLHRNQQRIVEAVFMEFCHRAQVRRVHFRWRTVPHG